MLKLTDDEACKLYDSIFSYDMQFIDIAPKVDEYKGEYKVDLRNKFCDILIDTILRGKFCWKPEYDFADDEIINLYCMQADKLGDNNPFHCGVAAFFRHEYEKCLKYIDIDYYKKENKDKIFTAENIGFSLFSTYKNAFPGFWSHIKNIMQDLNTRPGTIEFIDAIETYYSNTNIDIIIEKFSKVLILNNDCITAKEILSVLYSENKMWHNAIAYYEQIDEPQIYFLDDLYFRMAWAYDKIKDYHSAIKYYKMCLGIIPDYIFAMNNLGYDYYRLKDYKKAEKTLKKCVSESNYEEERKFAFNNLIRVYADAKEFEKADILIEQIKIKPWKATLERLNNSKSGKAKPTKIESNDLYFKSKDIDFGLKAHQFTSEKILEDELTLRIKSGQLVFGKKLKIYKRKGEYGRQYIFEKGRLDLLAEDENGNLYIIELKKDSGYDDAYNQIVAYVDWFTKHKIKGNQKVYGIICLNNPKEDLINAVKNDDRISLFEYKISYNEIS